ncbi:MAG: Holliday junction branch migration protein RuvA, partial [Thermodesulfobacteriota bacterium]
EMFLHIHTSVREDAITLFGFATPEEKELFLLLNTVSGVGPKLALGILSGIAAPELSEALRTKNISRLTALSGVGKKTAERLCIELRDKVAQYAGPRTGGEITAAEETLVEGDNVQDALSALTNLGYPQALAWQALRKVQKLHPEDMGRLKVEELIREALRTFA